MDKEVQQDDDEQQSANEDLAEKAEAGEVEGTPHTVIHSTYRGGKNGKA